MSKFKKKKSFNLIDNVNEFLDKNEIDEKDISLEGKIIISLLNNISYRLYELVHNYDNNEKE